VGTNETGDGGDGTFTASASVIAGGKVDHSIPIDGGGTSAAVQSDGVACAHRNQQIGHLIEIEAIREIFHSVHLKQKHPSVGQVSYRCSGCLFGDKGGAQRFDLGRGVDKRETIFHQPASSSHKLLETSIHSVGRVHVASHNLSMSALATETKVGTDRRRGLDHCAVEDHIAETATGGHIEQTGIRCVHTVILMSCLGGVLSVATAVERKCIEEVVLG